MKFKFIFILLSALIHTFPGFAQVKSSTFNLTLKILLSRDVPEITATEAAKNADNYLFLDAREQKEYNVSHLPNAEFIGYDHFNPTSLAGVAKDKALVVYCTIGKRSEDITRRLRKAGYGNVHNLYGGIFEWVNTGNRVYDLKGKPTEKVHAYGKFWGKFLDRGTKVY